MMKTLLCALVFLFPLAVIAEESALPKPAVVLKGLPYSLDDSGRRRFRGEADASAAEHLQLQLNCCTRTLRNPEKSVFFHQKRSWLRHLKETQRVRLNIFDSEAVLSTRESSDGAWHLGRVGKHSRVYGVEYRRTVGVLDDPRLLDRIFRWLVPPETP